ncbi:hypothetical protein IQ265_15305 [Nodosilinea sp. LEGE 06152]|uniref:hypothetical protein n=1 Tax=Nodosilinea sp. LEGE 06152 TaxID=2777966 RepID=UPI00187F4668|nr:hypothetical protein [Nodosilinea sp. LEGE 06152]MBE9158184.1 hypothetical protein [Nodosilinea sp. LEGE 06152]
MRSDLQALRITQSELDQLTGLDISSVFMGGMIRPSVWRRSKTGPWRLPRRKILSLLLTESLVLGTAFIVCLGLGLVLVRHRAGFDQFGKLVLGVATAIALGAVAWHFYQWHRAKAFVSLARLLDECDRHNDIIQALHIMDELEAVRMVDAELCDRTEVLAALQATRDSLISALRTETILRRHRAIVQRQQELFATIEINLTTLQTLHSNHQASEYRQFLQEALSIGLAVQREISANSNTG